MKLSEENKSILLVSIHKSIEESANTNASHLFHGRLSKLINYPSNGGFTPAELIALDEIKGKETLKSALRKIMANSTADVFFEFFNVVDGTADPDPSNSKWSEVMIVNKPSDLDEDREFWHDDFYGSYWDWKEKRKNSNWSLDLDEDS